MILIIHKDMKKSVPSPVASRWIHRKCIETVDVSLAIRPQIATRRGNLTARGECIIMHAIMNRPVIIEERNKARKLFILKPSLLKYPRSSVVCYCCDRQLAEDNRVVGYSVGGWETINTATITGDPGFLLFFFPKHSPIFLLCAFHHSFDILGHLLH